MERKKADKIHELEAEVKSLKKTCELLMDKVEYYQDSLDDHFSAFEKNFQLNKEVLDNQSKVEDITRLLSNERNKLHHIMRSLPGVLLVLDQHGQILESYHGIDFPNSIFHNRRTINEALGEGFQKSMIEEISGGSFSKRGTTHFMYNFVKDSWDLWFSVGVSVFKGREIVVSLRDVTEAEKNRQEALEQEAHMFQSAKLASLGEMAGGIAHEINNPLTIIGSRAQYLSQLLKSQEAEEQVLVDNIDVIINMVNRITQITKSMRKLSRDTKGEPKTAVFISQVLNDIKGICAEKFHHKGIALDFNISRIFNDHKVLVYPGELAQVLINLLNNAFDAVEQEDQKSVEVVVELLQDHCMVIKVKDSGPGVPEHVRSKIFTPFFTTKEVGRGTGLGLGLSKTIVEKHGGRFYLDTNDQLTSFVIELPQSLADGGSS